MPQAITSPNDARVDIVANGNTERLSSTIAPERASAALTGFASTIGRMSQRERGPSIRPNDDFMTTDVAYDMQRSVQQRVCSVDGPLLIAAFVIPVAAGDMFIERLTSQLQSCHNRLCTMGIFKEWPLHMDSMAVKTERDRTIPVAVTISYVTDKLKQQQDQMRLLLRILLALQLNKLPKC